MRYSPDKHQRRSIRLKEYDYSQTGAYFITICTHNRECLFGNVVDGEMVLNELGKIVESQWIELPKHYHNVQLDAFVIMPNHVHEIIILMNNVGAGFKPASTNRLSEIVKILLGKGIVGSSKFH